jgi:signal transduction histidine kinase
VLTADGGQRLVEWHGRPVFKNDGRFEYFFGVGIDVTERRKAEQEKTRLRAQLYQMQKLEAVGQLAGGVAHDFNNLLAVIMGNVSIVRHGAPLSPKANEALDDIMDAAERGSSLTRQLLTCARGGLQEPIPTDLNRLVRTTLPLVQRSAPKGLSFECQLGADLQPVLADPPRIEQVFINLTINSIQASRPPATISVRTAVRTPDPPTADRLGLTPSRYAVLEVADQGEGIDPDIQQRIFEPFFTTKPMGRGLGLAVTLGIVQSHGGQILVDSKPGHGSTFAVWLPLPRSIPKQAGL